MAQPVLKQPCVGAYVSKHLAAGMRQYMRMNMAQASPPVALMR